MDRDQLSAIYVEQLQAMDDLPVSINELIEFLGEEVLPEFTTGLRQGFTGYANDVGIDDVELALAFFAGANFGGIVATNITVNNLRTVMAVLREHGIEARGFNQYTLNLVNVCQRQVLEQLWAWLFERHPELADSMPIDPREDGKDDEEGDA